MNKVACNFCGKSFVEGRGIKIHQSKCKAAIAVQLPEVPEVVLPEIQEIVFNEVVLPETQEIVFDEPVDEPAQIVRGIIDEIFNRVVSKNLLSMDSEDDQVSTMAQEVVICSCCGKPVHDLIQAKIQCLHCVVGSPVNVDDVMVQK